MSASIVNQINYSQLHTKDFNFVTHQKISNVFNGNSEQQSIYPVKLPAVFVKQIDKKSENNTSSETLISVKDLKQRLYNHPGRFPGKVFHKYSLGRELEDNMVLSEEEAMHVEYHIGKILLLVLRLRGAGIFFPFSSLQDAHYTEFSSTAPKWRYVGKGLNLYGICQTNSCEAFAKEVIIIKGIGHVENIAKHLRTSECPLCHKAVKDVKSMCLYYCKYKINGQMVRPEEREVTLEGSANRKDGSLQFSSETADWSYLSITTSPLDEEGWCIIF